MYGLSGTSGYRHLHVSEQRRKASFFDCAKRPLLIHAIATRLRMDYDDVRTVSVMQQGYADQEKPALEVDVVERDIAKKVPICNVRVVLAKAQRG